MRHRLATLILSFAVLATAGCGFHLRGTTQVPRELKTLTLETSDPYSDLSRAIREELRLNDVSIVKAPMRTDLPSLRLLGSNNQKDTVSIYQDGSTAEYKMVLKVQAQVLLPGKDIYPLDVTVYRAFFDNPLMALAKDAEQDIIKKEMQQQAARQLVRQMISLHKDVSADVKSAKKSQKVKP